MATRRTRIKGIANIPPRKRLTDPSKKGDDVINNVESNSSLEGLENLVEKESNTSCQQSVDNNASDKETNSCSQITNGNEIGKVLESSTNDKTISETINSELSNHEQQENHDKTNSDCNQENPVKINLSRRKFFKPTVSVKAINRKVTTWDESRHSDGLLGNDVAELKVQEEPKTSESKEQPEEQEIKVPPVIRRKPIKSAVSINSLNKKPRISKTEQTESNQELANKSTVDSSLNGSEKSSSNTSISNLVNNSIVEDANDVDKLVNVDQVSIPSSKVSLVNDVQPKSVKVNILGNICITETSNHETANLQEESKKTDLHDMSKEINNAKEPLLSRRKFIKPSISLSALNKKSKLIVSTSELRGERQTDHQLEENVNPLKESIESSLSDITESRVMGIERIDVQEENQTTLDEVDLTPNKIVSFPEGSTLKKPITIITGTQSDIDYPPPPPSPSKINRSRIKAVPRLNYRKASFSASESEDEARKGGHRIRNDSVCSTTSGIAESITEYSSPQKSREINSIIQKKCNRTEQTRKLVEARKEFQKRFGTNKPDRQQLTMMDLIFYNPESNPIIQSETTEIKTKVDKQEENESEKIDDPVKEASGKSEEEEEDNDIPGPQVKIGPSGEIILDEKSLVIERKELKRKQEEIQKSEVVDGDFDRGYGIYKKHKRSKKWSAIETLRFYKALNTIGTDFTLMLEFFPNRTRREIKMKFKKEEKINQLLIDKALLQPCNFDFDELQNEIDTEQKENEELERQRLEKIKLKEKRKLEKPKKRKFSVVEKLEIIEKIPPKLPKRRKVKKNNKMKINESDADESDLQTQSESEDELILQHPPTRSGRLPKVPEKFQSEDLPISASTLNITRKPSKVAPIKEQIDTKDSTEIQDEPPPVQIEPGSIMIMCDKGPSGEPVYKIFMVTPQQSATPVNLTPDAIAKAIEFKKGIAAENIITISANNTDDEDTLPEENNYTIPADENITSLRSNPVTDDEIDESKRILKYSGEDNTDPEYILPDQYNSELEDKTDSNFKKISVTSDDSDDNEISNNVIEFKKDIIQSALNSEVNQDIEINNPTMIADRNISDSCTDNEIISNKETEIYIAEDNSNVG